MMFGWEKASWLPNSRANMPWKNTQTKINLKIIKADEIRRPLT